MVMLKYMLLGFISPLVLVIGLIIGDPIAIIAGSVVLTGLLSGVFIS